MEFLEVPLNGNIAKMSVLSIEISTHFFMATLQSENKNFIIITHFY